MLKKENQIPPFAANGPVPSRRRPGATARLPCHCQHRLQQTLIYGNRSGSFCCRPLSAAVFRRSWGGRWQAIRAPIVPAYSSQPPKHRALTHRSTMAHSDPQITEGSSPSHRQPYLHSRTLLVAEGTHWELPSRTVTFQRHRSRGCEHNSSPATQVPQRREHAAERGREPKLPSLLGPVPRNSVQSYRFDRERAQALRRIPAGNASDIQKWNLGHNS
jgi:hypothetical protein